jgi:ketosteroid isomerase-like protein
MSQEDVEIVRRMYEAFHRGDFDCALAYFNSEVEVDASVEVETRYAVLYEIRGDRITRMVLHSGPAEALEAAGLSE